MEQLKLFKEGDDEETTLAQEFFNANGNVFDVAKKLGIPVNELLEKEKSDDLVKLGKHIGNERVIRELEAVCFENLFDLIDGYRTNSDGDKEDIPPTVQLQAIKLALEIPKARSDAILKRVQAKVYRKELEQEGDDDGLDMLAKRFVKMLDQGS